MLWIGSLALNTFDWPAILENGKAGLRGLVGGADLRPVLVLPRVAYFGCLIFDCVDTVMPGIFLPQQSTWSQSSRPSFPNTQKKRKMKKPCSELNMAKRNWKAVEASRIVRAPKTHISPNRAITPMRLIMSLMTVCGFALSLLLNRFWLCLMSTVAIITKIIALKSMMAKMGPRKAPKKTLVSPMKQLEKREWIAEHIIAVFVRPGCLLSYCVHVSSIVRVIGSVDSWWWKCDHKVSVNCQRNDHWNNWYHCSEREVHNTCN